ncbi:hypothetical protein LZG04_10815 [Saccharothrix sp. S26]|uniref:PrpF domain-containing protein n=1 Tax=Saccharothrix sp. S26 TaxID=2907215 RepID=UPI001F37141D|nr:PrpF domain-containing protein [Saccharothrix sp. S26]MCE6995298.1 hypothetical protein [Saccharothrix sp. S26]
MLAHVLQAEGSPCPTLVLPAEALPSDEARLVPALAAIRRWLCAIGAGHVLKFAVVGRSRVPGHDLEYRFVQCLPGDEPRFELRGSCGHSVLAAVAASGERGLVPRLRPGSRVRVAVLNNGDSIRCGVDAVTDGAVVFTVRFTRRDRPDLADLLLLGEPRTELRYAGGKVSASVVSMGNPYLFVDARELGIGSTAALFGGGERLFGALSEVRAAGERLLGWPPGAFPKVAALLPDQDGAVAARAVSVPSWHPTLALTGAVCVAAAAAIPGTVPALLGRPVDGLLTVTGPLGATTVVSSVVAGRLAWVSVSPKVVRPVTVLRIPVFTRRAALAA